MCKIKLILIKTCLKQVLSSFGCSLMMYVQLSSVFLWFDNERVAPEKQNRKATSSPGNGKGVGKRVFTPIYTPCIYTLMLLWKRYTCIKGSMYFIPDYHPSVWGNQSSPTAAKHPELPLLTVQNQAGLTRSNHPTFKFISHQRDIWCRPFLFAHLQISHFRQSLFFIINHLQITTDRENRLWYCSSKHDMNQHSYHLNE